MRRLSAGEAGLILIPMGALSAFISQPISRRNLVRGPLLPSAVCMLLGGVAVLFLTSASSLRAIVGVTALSGLATGGTSVANQTAFRSGVTDTGLHGMSCILIGVGVLVLLMSVLDRRLTGPALSTTKFDNLEGDMAAMTTAVAPLDPERTALLLMDFQPAIISALPDHEELLGRARTALAWAREHGVKVVFVRVAFTAEDYDAIPRHNKAFAAADQD
ncbi:hypothetical protein AB0L65_37090 [Nonomuraea sp. NPDC052116]|uniref:hypothetical protein n=1 Tax=Nonomuraea sp. NPDC052116 TaxID=3155665 RepID=UPI003414B150